MLGKNVQEIHCAWYNHVILILVVLTMFSILLEGNEQWCSPSTKEMIFDARDTYLRPLWYRKVSDEQNFSLILVVQEIPKTEPTIAPNLSKNDVLLNYNCRKTSPNQVYASVLLLYITFEALDNTHPWWCSRKNIVFSDKIGYTLN